jgi:hypothetical protein
MILMPERDFAEVPAEGVRIYQNAFYTRAIQQGDLEIVPDEAPATAEVASTSKTK